MNGGGWAARWLGRVHLPTIRGRRACHCRGAARRQAASNGPMWKAGQNEPADARRRGALYVSNPKRTHPFRALKCGHAWPTDTHPGRIPCCRGGVSLWHLEEPRYIDAIPMVDCSHRPCRRRLGVWSNVSLCVLAKHEYPVSRVAGAFRRISARRGGRALARLRWTDDRSRVPNQSGAVSRRVVSLAVGR